MAAQLGRAQRVRVPSGGIAGRADLAALVGHGPLRNHRAARGRDDLGDAFVSETSGWLLGKPAGPSRCARRLAASGLLIHSRSPKDQGPMGPVL